MIFQTSSLTFGQAKTQIAEAAGKQQTPEFLDRAGRAIQYAIRRWNTKNWKWTTQETTFPVVANTTQYPLPYDFKDVYSLRLEGMFDRALIQKPRRDFDRRTWKQVPAYPVAYNLLWAMPQGKLELMPYPVMAETGHMRYYARMTVPCSVTASATTAWTSAADTYLTTTYTVNVGNTAGITIGSPYVCSNSVLASATGTVAPTSGIVVGIVDTSNISVTSSATGLQAGTLVIGGDAQFLDIPDTYGDGILAMATVKFLVGIGASPDKINEFRLISDTAWSEANGAENEAEDEDISFEPPTHEPGHFLAPFIVTSQ